MASGTFSDARAGMFWLFMFALLIWLVLILWECAVILNLALMVCELCVSLLTVVLLV